MTNTLTLPQYILWQHQTAKITPLKLQKLLYYVKVWGLVAGADLYEGEFEKWTHGPVNSEVYHTYKKHVSSPILPPYKRPPFPKPAARELIDFIVDAYLPFSATSLSAMTHKETPWQETPAGATIGRNKIISFYSKQPFAKNFNPFAPAKKPYYPVQSDSWHAFVLDMTDEDANRHAQFASYQQYQDQLKQARADVSDLERSLDELLGS